MWQVWGSSHSSRKPENILTDIINSVCHLWNVCRLHIIDSKLCCDGIVMFEIWALLPFCNLHSYTHYRFTLPNRIHFLKELMAHVGLKYWKIFSKKIMCGKKMGVSFNGWITQSGIFGHMNESLWILNQGFRKPLKSACSTNFFVQISNIFRGVLKKGPFS